MSKKKIVIISQGISPVVKALVESSHHVEGIIECAPRGFKTNVTTFLVKFLKDIFSVKALKNYARKNRVNYFFMNNGCDDSLETWVTQLKPDLIVVYSMSQLLKENIYGIPVMGTINLHPSYLPYYRGPNPWFWMYYYMEEQGGITIHYIDQGEDTGDILAQRKFQIPLGAKLSDVYELAIAHVGVELLLDVIERIDQISPVKQSTESPTRRAKNISEGKHKSIIKWDSWDVKRVWHVLRGTESWLNAIPQPGGIYVGHRWIIDEFEISEPEINHTPGVVYTEKGRQFVSCKNGRVYLKIDFFFLY